MIDLDKLVQSSISKIRQVAQGFTQAPVVHNPLQYFNPTSNGGNNFWSSRPAQGLVTAQNAVQNVAQKAPLQIKAPEFNFKNPIANTAANLPGQLVTGVVNSPGQYLQGIARAGQNIGQGNFNPKELAGNAAQIAQFPLLFVGGGAAKNVLGKELGLGTKVLMGAKTGAKVGGAFGALSGIESGAQMQNNLDYAKNLALNTAGGAVLGGALGATAPIASEAFSKLNKNKPFVENIGNLVSHEGAPDHNQVLIYKNKLQRGLPVEPLVVVPEKNGLLGVEDGKHRLEAYRQLGIDKIPVIFKDGMKPGFAKIPGKNNAAEGRLYDVKPIDDYLTQKYGIKLDKASKSQITEALEETKGFVPHNENIVKKLTNTNKGWVVTPDDRPVLYFGGQKQGVYTDGFIAILDKEKADLLRNSNIDSYVKKVTKDYTKQGLNYNDAVKAAKERVGQTIKGVSEQNYPDVNAVIPQSPGTKAFIQGVKSGGYSNNSLTILSDGKTQVLVDSNKLGLLKKLFPDSELRITEQLKAVKVVEKGKLKGLLMPVRGEGGFPVPANYIPKSVKTVEAIMPNNVAQPPFSDVTKTVENQALQAEKTLSPAQRTQAHIQEYQAAKTSTAPQTPSAPDGTGGSSLDKGSSKMAYNINKENLQLNKADKEVLDTTINAIKPELEKAKGKTLTNDEVVKAAKTSNILQKVTTREETEAANAAMLKARQRMVELDKSVSESIKSGNTEKAQAQMRDLIDSLRVVSSNAADAGRRLQSLSIEATDESLRSQLIKDITKTGASTDDILNAANKVDWENANSVAEFYRKFIKPTVPEILDEYRYNNMLSSPKTHIRNAFSNAIQTFVTRPATLLVEGKPVEAAKYFGGALKSFPEAIKAFGDSFSGKTVLEKPDLNRISTTKLPRFLTIPTRAMEAGDKFFTALIQGGELARGATAEQAAKTAEYSLFRQGLHPEGQGKVLNAIDDMTAWTYKAPKAVRWFVPFIRTPMNFAKQWIEYSPAGFSTIPGAANKKEQLAKAIIGSTITTFGAGLALQGRTTWAAPTDSKEKDYFYASGRKPFSIKIGDSWVPMQYAGPFALALAIPAAMKYFQEDNRTAPTDSGLDKAVKTTGAMAQFFSQQTWLSGLGNFVNWASGDQDYSLPSSLGFTAQQIIPMEALISYVNSIIDPVYRKSNSFTGSIQKNIPGLSQQLEPYTQPTGENSVRSPLNYVLPYDIGRAQESGINYDSFLQGRQNQLQENAKLNELKKQLTSGKTPKDGEQATYTIGGVEYQGFTSGDKFVGMDADGNQVTKSIKDIEKAQRSDDKGIFDAEFSLQKDRLTRAGDYIGIAKLNQTKLEYYKEYQKTLDKVKDKKEWTTIQNAIEDLEYSLKGGKGKKFKIAKFVPIKAPKALNIKLSGGKSLTVPKMNIPQMTFKTQFTPSGVVPNVPVFKNKVNTKLRLAGGGNRKISLKGLRV